jgi:hypothetical protein
MKIGRVSISSLILSITLIVICMSFMLTIVNAQASQTGAASGTPKFLAIQHAAMGSVSEINSTSYSLHYNLMIYPIR